MPTNYADLSISYACTTSNSNTGVDEKILKTLTEINAKLDTLTEEPEVEKNTIKNDICCSCEDCKSDADMQNTAQNFLEDMLDFALQDCLENCIVLPDIKTISYCDEPGKAKVIVIFNDGTKIIKAPAAGDIFDLNVGVALCVMERLCGSKSAYHKMINKKLSKQFKKKKN